MKEHDTAYWQAQLQLAFQVAYAPPVREGEPIGTSVPGSRVLISQAQLDASRMLRYIPRLPVQNANWLNFAYAPSYRSSLHQNLALELFSLEAAAEQLQASSKTILLRLCQVAIVYERMERQGDAALARINSRFLAQQASLSTPSPEAWRKSRWAPRWRRLLARIRLLDCHSIEQLVELQRAVRHCREISRCHSNLTSKP